MQVYQYDRAGLLLGTTEADESPLEPGVWLLPARTTAVAPPEEIPDGQWPRWNGSSWALVPIPAPQPAPAEPDPVAKLAAFLEQNPDVAELISSGV